MVEGGKTTQNPILKLVAYLHEAKEELGKVSWPSRPETIRYSALVIGISLGVALFLAALDWVFSLGLQELIRVVQP